MPLRPKIPDWRLVLAATAVVGGLVAWGQFPLGWPGEWEWDRYPLPPDFLVNVLLLTVWGGVYALYVWCGLGALPYAKGGETFRWLLGLTLLGSVWLWLLQETGPVGFRWSKTAWVLYYPGSSGYFTQARDNVTSLPQFLRGYEDEMAKGDVLHIGTHPPGLTVANYLLLQWCERSPGLCAFLRATEPESLREAFAIVEVNSARTATPLTAPQRAALWLFALITLAAAAATVVPLYYLSQHFAGFQSSAWLSAALWPFVPAVAVFLPKSDVLYPFIATTFLCLWLDGIFCRSAWRCGLAGLVLCLGMFLSLALLPVAFLGALVVAGELWLTRGKPERRSTELPLPNPGWRGLAGCGGAFAAGFLTPVLLLWLTCGLNLFHAWQLNLQNHAAFYGQFTRTYWKWLVANPIELMVAAGVPLLWLAVPAIVFVVRAPLPDGVGLGRYAKQRRWEILACLLTWMILWLSGKNSGEAARLWLFLMPWLCGMSAMTWDIPVRPDERSAVWHSYWPLLAIQAAFDVLIVGCVAGFHVP